MNIIPPKFTNWLKVNRQNIFFGAVFIFSGSGLIYFLQESLTEKTKTPKLELSTLENISEENLELKSKIIELERELYKIQSSNNIIGIKISKTSGVDQKTLQTPHLININLSNLVELEELPGIGPSKAQAIMDYRKRHGKFSSKEQLLEVGGIGPNIFSKIESLLTL